MDSLHRLLEPNCTRAQVSANSRKRALEIACEALANAHALNPREILEQLLARERLGSTALGEGVALPHCRLPNCKQAIGALLSLDRAVEFDSPDDNDVDLLFVLIVPKDAQQQHLAILADLAAIFIQPENRERLRSANNHDELFSAMLDLSKGLAA